MQNVLRDIRRTKDEIGHIDVFCDYDGVLAPIAPCPQDARLDTETRRLLRLLSGHGSMHMNVVSGRSLADIRKRVGVPGITYAGNHGLEIDGPGVRKVRQLPDHMCDSMRSLAEALQIAMRRYAGVIVEDKTLTVAVHFRQADPGQIPGILGVFSSLVAERNAAHLLRVTSGKCVIEARPNVEWDKGHAVRFLLEKRHGTDWPDHTVAVYLGDDETDEDAFLALRDHGITVRVGRKSPGTTAARYALHDTGEVSVFLDRLLHIFPRT